MTKISHVRISDLIFLFSKYVMIVCHHIYIFTCCCCCCCCCCCFCRRRRRHLGWHWMFKI